MRLIGTCGTQQIPFGDDKSKGDGKGNGKDAAVAEMLFG
jgi:hypothetical protein